MNPVRDLVIALDIYYNCTFLFIKAWIFSSLVGGNFFTVLFLKAAYLYFLMFLMYLMCFYCGQYCKLFNNWLFSIWQDEYGKYILHTFVCVLNEDMKQKRRNSAQT